LRDLLGPVATTARSRHRFTLRVRQGEWPDPDRRRHMGDGSQSTMATIVSWSADVKDLGR